MIQVQGLIKDYSKFRAVNNVSFEVKAGEVFGFLGPNGAGKTTTMRMIAGLLMPTEGTISIGGFDLATHAKEAKRISSFIPDRPYLYEKLTAMEFLLFVGGLSINSNGPMSFKRQLKCCTPLGLPTGEMPW